MVITTKERRDPRPTFVRFVVPHRHPDTGTSDGIFGTAYALRREGELPRAEWFELDETLKWFGKNLAIPHRFNRTKSKGWYRRNTKGISWLKSSATEHVSRMHHLASILERHNRHVTMIRTIRPGYVVYEDEHQIVAEPFNDLPR